MIQLVMSHGKDSEEVMELVDAPEFLLIKFCDGYLRHQNIRHPQVHAALTDIAAALKIKVEKEADGPFYYNRYDLKEYARQLEETLQQYPPYEEEEEEKEEEASE